MTPDLQNMLAQAQQNVAAAQRWALFVGYSSYAALIICALFSVLIFCKLCQIAAPVELPLQVQQPNIFRRHHTLRVGL